MDENTDDETLDNPLSPLSENPQDEILSTNEMEILIPKEEIKNMEVHHHPDLHHKPKKWKEYFLEFLMIFLAVTLGFFAESYREHLVDRTKEGEYVNSLVEDLKGDSAFLAISINQRIPYHIKWLDSTIHLLELPSLDGKDREMYQAYFLGTSWTYNYHPNVRTLSQLHSGGFNVIRNKNVITAISLLEAQTNLTTATDPFLFNLQTDIDASSYVFAEGKVTDAIGQIAFKNYYLDYSAELNLSDIPLGSHINTTNKAGIQSYIKKLRKYTYFVQTALKGQDISLLRSLTSTIAILNKEYHLE